MTIDEAIEVLELHNQWRKGAEIETQKPVRIGMAIDLVVCELKNLRKPPVSGMLKCCSCGYEYEELIIAKDGNIKCKDCAF